MCRIAIPLSDTDMDILFDVNLEPADFSVETFKSESNKNGDFIKTLLGKKNLVSVGVPTCENFITYLLEDKQELPIEVKKNMNSYDFYLLSLSCSFLPDIDCTFTWARFGIELKAISRDSDEVLKERPIVISMIPDEINTEVKCKREISRNFDINTKFKIVESDCGTKRTDNIECVIYEPQITAFGIDGPNAYWDFKATSSSGVHGNKKGLMLVLKTPKNSKLKGRFILSAEVKIGNLLGIPLKKRSNEMIDKEYVLI